MRTAARGSRRQHLPTFQSLVAGTGDQRVRDRLEDARNVRSDDRKNADRCNRDERRDQGVLDERLTILALAQKLNEAEQDPTSLRCDPG